MHIKELLYETAFKLNIELTSYQIEQFMLYKDILLEWNKKINLTAITNPEDIVIKHFIDSLTCAKYINNGQRLIDIGTGAGFPGIPLKILFSEEISITLLDSLNKRIRFLTVTAEALKLNKINIIHGRAEDLAKDNQHREAYDIALSRAVANLSVLAEYCLPFVKIGGIMLSMKGHKAEDEVIDANKAIKTLGGNVKTIESIKLPDTDIKHTIILINKIKSSPEIYPRKAGTINKNPIC